MPILVDTPPDSQALRASWTSDLERLAARQDWGLAILALGWIHLSYGCLRQWLEMAGLGHPAWLTLAWAIELAIVILAMRLIAGQDWFRGHPIAQSIWCTWISCIALGGILAAWNLHAALPLPWYQPSTLALGALCFAVTAWLASAWFLAPALILCAAGCLWLAFPLLGHLIDAAAWWLATHSVGVALASRRSRVLSRPEPNRWMSGVRVHIPVHLARYRRVS